MKKGFIFIFLIFAVVFTCPVILMLTETAAEPVPFAGVLIFICVDLLLWGGFITCVVKTIKDKNVAKKGEEFTATFVSFASNVSVNGVPRFFITYAWTNAQGEQKHGKSASDYTIHEAEAFEMAQTFKIKALGNESVIITKPEELVIEYKNAITNDGKYICKYCDSVYDETENKCPNCKAPRNK